MTVGSKDGCLALLDDVRGAAYRAGQVEVEHTAAGQPVEAHAGRGEVLLDGRGGFLLGEMLDVGGDVYRLNAGEREAVPVTI